MSCKYLSANIINNIIKVAEGYLHRKLITKKQVVLPNSVCIFDNDYSDGDPEQFALIFDIKINYQGYKTAIIRYYQIPLHLQHQGLGKKIYQIMEEKFRNVGCQLVTLEATADQQDNNHNAISFWEHLDFKKTPYCYPGNEICPMQKEL